MDAQKIIQSQYLVALAMFEQVIVKCPVAFWNALSDKDKFWEKAFHTLYYVHLYLQNVEADFRPWEKQHGDEDTPYPPYPTTYGRSVRASGNTRKYRIGLGRDATRLTQKLEEFIDEEKK